MFLVHRLFLFGTATPAFLGQLYRKWWTIEACFQNLKGRGFALRSTPLQGLDKLKKLVGLVSLAYAFCVSVGTCLHEKVPPIGVKNHAHKKVRFSRHGLNAIRQYSRAGAGNAAELAPQLDVLIRLLIR